MNFRLLALGGAAEKAGEEEASIATPKTRWPTEHYPDGEGLRPLHARSGISNHSRDINAKYVLAASTKQIIESQTTEGRAKIKGMGHASPAAELYGLGLDCWND